MKKSEIYKEAAKCVMESRLMMTAENKFEIVKELINEMDIQLICERNKEAREAANNAQDNE